MELICKAVCVNKKSDGTCSFYAFSSEIVIRENGLCAGYKAPTTEELAHNGRAKY